MSIKKLSAAEPSLGHCVAKDGAKIAYRLCTPKVTRSLIVLLHGLGADGSMYDPFGMALAQQGHLVCLPDMRGHGKSDGTPGDVSYIGQYTDDLLELLDHLHAQLPALPIFLGAHSAGNSLLLQVLHKRPELICGAFLLAPVLYGHAYYSRRQDSSDRLAFRLSQWATPPRWPKTESEGQISLDVKLHLFKYLLATLFPNLLGGLNVLSSRQSIAGAAPTVRHFSYRHHASLRCSNLESKLASIRVPILVAIGEHDQFTFPNAALSLFRWSLPPQTERQLMYIKGCRHFNILTVAGLIVGRWLDRMAPMRNAA